MLTPRLEMISSHIYTKKIADIGTDHAYIPIHLAMNNVIEKGIATDLRKGPLMIAESNIKKYNLSKKIKLRLGSGLEPVSDGEVQSVIIAGMGGDLIKSILSLDIKKSHSFEYLVLQPMNSQDVLRSWLSQNDFSIIKEDITTEGFKVYNLIIAQNGNMKPYNSEFECHLPPYLYSHPYFNALKDKKRREFEKIRNGLEKASEKDYQQIKKYSDFISELERI